MANNYGTLAGTKILQETLESLLATFPIIAQITRDFSGAGALYNQTTNTRVVVPGTAVAFVAATGYAAAARTTVDVPITLNQHYHHTFEVTDVEQSSTDRDLRGELVKTAAHALGKAIVDSLFATILAATYTQAYESSAAMFDTSRARKVKTQLNKNKVPDIDRFMVVNSDFAETLDIDSVIVANPNGTMQGGNANPTAVKMIHGFKTSEYTDLPTNNEKLAGIAGNREAVIMQARVPAIPADKSEISGRIASVTEPNTGLTVQHRRYYDMGLGKLVESLTLMWGFGAGLSETGLSKRLTRIVTP
jgi:hypothetical protein